MPKRKIRRNPTREVYKLFTVVRRGQPGQAKSGQAKSGKP
jgi:hypothetical protein